MSTSTLAHSARPLTLPLLYPLQAALAGAWRGGATAWQLARRRQKQKARDAHALRELQEMSERDLADMGIRRCDVPRLTNSLDDWAWSYDIRAWDLHRQLAMQGRTPSQGL